MVGGIYAYCSVMTEPPQVAKKQKKQLQISGVQNMNANKMYDNYLLSPFYICKEIQTMRALSEQIFLGINNSLADAAYRYT